MVDAQLPSTGPSDAADSTVDDIELMSPHVETESADAVEASEGHTSPVPSTEPQTASAGNSATGATPAGRDPDIPTEEIPLESASPQPLDAPQRLRPAPVYLKASEMGITPRSKRKGAPPKRRAPLDDAPLLELDQPTSPWSAVAFAAVWLAALMVAGGIAFTALAGLGVVSWWSATGRTEPAAVVAEPEPQATPQVPPRPLEPADEEPALGDEPEEEVGRSEDLSERPASPSPRPAPRPEPPEPGETVGADNPWDVPAETPVLEAQPEADSEVQSTGRRGRRKR